ncbi:MAG: hypothetical protein IJB79_02345 [Candidatus Gastranaerophilales bacterium]|nr:hypothetical protein [Candidatus Gastranaerophilales bacterium]
MHFLTHFTIALISLITIVLSCILFTNAIEFLGNKLKLGNSATGSILAVIGTGLPELIVPIVAIFGVYFTKTNIDVAKDIALGAILGSPFALSTLALFLLSFVLIIQKRNKLNVEHSFVLREYKYFLLSYSIAVLFSFGVLYSYRYFAVLFLLLMYGIFVYRTILKSRIACVECECEGLLFLKKNNSNVNLVLFLQLFFSLFVLVLASHFFVKEINFFSLYFGASPAIIALIITPFATELPECVNSLIWLKQNKDELALANILGAIVFQSTVLFSIGILLTPWNFSESLFINALFAFLASLVLFVFVLFNKKICLTNLLFCGIVYFSYLTIVLVK